MTTNNLNNTCLNDFAVTSATSADTSTLTVSNTSNTASSIAATVISVSTTSTSDLYTRYAVGTTAQYAMGIDNSDSDDWKIAYAASGATPSSTAIITSDSTGRILRPATTMFRAYLAVTKTSVTGDNTDYAIPLDTEDFDIGSNFNTSTGVYTAPVAGKYLFVGLVTGEGLGSDTLGTSSSRLHVNGAEGSIIIIGTEVTSSSGASGARLSWYCSSYISLAANDTIELGIRVDGSAGGKDTDILGDKTLTYLCGMLIG